MIEPGLVSTIIPVYNRAAKLRDAVASVLAQDWRPIEVIIVDDGSTDGTAALGEQVARESGGVARMIHRANGGPGAARESGRLAARGEFIQYLDSDDVLLPGKFRLQVQALREHPECDVAYGMTRFRRRDGTLEPGAWKGSGTVRETMFPSFLNERWWDTPTPLYRRSISDRAGPWTDLRLEEDWEYDCRIAALGARLAWCEAYVCEVRDHDDDRLSRGHAHDAARQAVRAKSHALVYAHARRSGITSDSPEMQRFARTLFLLARQCGACGLPVESGNLFELALEAAGKRGRRRIDFRLYRLLAAVVGWRWAGKASGWVDGLRRFHAHS